MTIQRWTLLALLAACQPVEPTPQALVLERFQPANRDGVFLNEDLVLTFSEELDRDSITADSFVVVDSEGRPAQGRRVVGGRSLRFQPAPVLDPELQEGGYRPSTEYRVLLRGFPRLGAIRDLEGRPLSSSHTFQLRTVDVEDRGSDRGAQVFDDASPAAAQPLRLQTPRKRVAPWVLYPSDPIWLDCEEPVDPSSLRDEDFVLRLGVGAEGRVIPVKARLLSNFDEGEAPLATPCARIELVPVERLDPGIGSLKLTLGFAPDFSLTDFSGNPVWRRGLQVAAQEITVVPHPGVAPEDRVLLDFIDSKRFIPVAVPGADGTAQWGLDGRLGVNYPAAAGDGSMKVVDLAKGLPSNDVAATRMFLERGERCELPAGGLLVLRSQGSLRIAGELVREGRSSQGEDLHRRRMPRQSLSRWLESKAQPSDGWAVVLGQGALGVAGQLAQRRLPIQELKLWLERLERKAQSSDEWTVLIAGGDLVIEDEGVVDVDTPLLLVAGGRIRALGSVRRETDKSLWLLGRGGSLEFGFQAETPNLRIDPPLENPLEQPLRFAAVSTQIPSRARAVRWNNPTVVGSPGSGSYSVRYQLASQEGFDPSQAVDHPRLLDGEGPVRLLIELEFPAAATSRSWDPPWIDSVQLSWEVK